MKAKFQQDVSKRMSQLAKQRQFSGSSEAYCTLFLLLLCELMLNCLQLIKHYMLILIDVKRYK